MPHRNTKVGVHTGPATIAPRAAWARTLLPDVRIVNVVDDSVRTDTIAAGAVMSAVRRRLAQDMTIEQETGADLISNACAPVREAAAALLDIPVLTIDAAMAEQAVHRAERIGVAATIQTTLDRTARPIEAAAFPLCEPVRVKRLLCDGASGGRAGRAVRHTRPQLSVLRHGACRRRRAHRESASVFTGIRMTGTGAS